MLSNSENRRDLLWKILLVESFLVKLFALNLLKELFYRNYVLDASINFNFHKKTFFLV